MIPKARFLPPFTSMRSTLEGSSMMKSIDSKKSFVVTDVAAPVSTIANTFLPNIVTNITAASNVYFSVFIVSVSPTPAEDTFRLLKT